jgi:hypothetical protein
MTFELHLSGTSDARTKISEPTAMQAGIGKEDIGLIAEQRKSQSSTNLTNFGFASSDRLLSNIGGPEIQVGGRNHPSPQHHHGPHHHHWLAGAFHHRHHDTPSVSWQPPQFTINHPYAPQVTHPHSYRTGPLVGSNDGPYVLPHQPLGNLGQIPQVHEPLPYTMPFTSQGDHQPLVAPADRPSQPISARTPDSQTDGQNHPFAPTDVAKTAATYGVNQAAHGDCWFESSLAGLAHSPKGPEAISKMITKTADGYVVTFPGDEGHPVKVSEADIKGDHLQDKAQWAKVIEAALIKHNPNEAEHGGDPRTAIALLTGESTSARYTKDVLPADLARKLAEGPVVASTPDHGPQVAGRTDHASNSDATVPNHAYTVVAYDEKTGMVTVRNPWGNNNGTAVGKVGDTHDGVTNQGNGVITMSYDTFQKKFSTVSSRDDNAHAPAQAPTWVASQYDRLKRQFT